MSLHLSNYRVMNEDVVERIFNYLEFRELFLIERTSFQFSFCVKRVLRRKKCLKFGETNKEIFCKTTDHRSDDQFDGIISSVLMDHKFDKNLISIFTKCQNIRSLYLNQVLNFEIIESIPQICKRLECLCLGNTFLSINSDHLRKIGLLFAERLIHLSIECYFIEDTIDGKVIEIIKHFKGLESLRIIHFKPLKNTLNYVSKRLRSLEINCSPFWFSDTFGDEDINSLIIFIESNERCLQRLIISDYHISEDLFTKITTYLDLKELSISCKLLSLKSMIKILWKNQKNISYLSLNGLSTEDTIIDSSRYYLRVVSLKLNSCHFEVKSFITFIETFRLLEKLEFSGLYFNCECNPSLNESFFCSTCAQKCIQHLSKSETLKELIVKDVTTFRHFWFLLLKISNLRKLKVPHFDGLNRTDIFKNMARLLLKFTQNSMKFFTLEFSDTKMKTLFIKELKQLSEEMPRKLQIK